MSDDVSANHISESIRINKPLVCLSVTSYYVRSREHFLSSALTKTRVLATVTCPREGQNILGPEIMLVGGLGKFVPTLAQRGETINTLPLTSIISKIVS